MKKNIVSNNKNLENTEITSMSKSKIYLIILNILIISLAVYGVIFSSLLIIDKKNIAFLEEKKEKLIQLKKIEEEQRKLEEKQRKIDYINSLDLESDDSITKFVDPKNSFNNLWYVPKNLVSLSWSHIIDWKLWTIKIRKIALDNLKKLAKEFYKETNNNIIVVSWYRSYVYQKGIKNRWCPDNLCSKAWFSEHQSGLAIDIYSASSEKRWTNDNNLRKYLKWFKENAWDFGFHNSYQKWLKIDGYEIEPWHWRYVWKELANYLNENNLTFTEFYKAKKKNKEKEELENIKKNIKNNKKLEF